MVAWKIFIVQQIIIQLLKELKIKGTAIIAGIIRGDKFIKPGGESVFEVNDKVLVVTTMQGVSELEQIIG